MEAKLEKESEDILSRIYGYLHEGGEGEFFRLYSSSTENISGYLPIFELSERKLWTLGSSFDHPINAALAGCREIKILDICPQTTIFSYLKRAALNTLKRQDFIRFFSIYLTEPDRKKGKYNQDFLSEETFEKVKNELESLDKVSSLIDHSISLGATNVNSLNFILSNKDAQCAELLSKASKL